MCMKCFKRSQDNATSTITVENKVEIDEKEEKDKISVKTAHNLVNKSMELFDCFPLKNVKPDRTFKQGKGRSAKLQMPNTDKN